MDNYLLIEALGRMELRDRLKFAEEQRLQRSARDATADRRGLREQARNRCEHCTENASAEYA